MLVLWVALLLTMTLSNDTRHLQTFTVMDTHREPHMRAYLKKLSLRKPVVFTGDLNCGHLDVDIYNPEAKHIVKQAGLTPQERQAFTKMVASDFQDAFRFFYPGSKTLLFSSFSSHC